MVDRNLETQSKEEAFIQEATDEILFRLRRVGGESSVVLTGQVTEEDRKTIEDMADKIKRGQKSVETGLIMTAEGYYEKGARDAIQSLLSANSIKALKARRALSGDDSLQ